jgi:hypothetical protein
LYPGREETVAQLDINQFKWEVVALVGVDLAIKHSKLIMVGHACGTSVQEVADVIVEVEENDGNDLDD